MMMTDVGSETEQIPVVPVFFLSDSTGISLSDSTGISAETMGNALLLQFPHLRFNRQLIPFISTAQEARRVVEVLNSAMKGPVTPLAFTTAATDEVRLELRPSECPFIDFFDLHLRRVESIL